ncbi:MAG: CsgG/HfaB family protein [Firmicutes bacterium]|nr:CsgG/HfaB family protein [Bacillota bacterium]
MFRQKKRLVLMLMIFLLILVTPLWAMDLDDSIENLAKQLGEDVAGNEAPVIVVWEFSDLDGKLTAFGKYVVEELTTALVRTKKFQVMERELLNKVLEEHQLDFTGFIDRDSAKEIGKLSGANAVVCGTITEFEKNVKINARLIATQTGNIISVASVEVQKDADVIKFLSKVLVEVKPVTNLGNTDKPAVRTDSRTLTPTVAVKPTEPIPTPGEGSWIKSYGENSAAENFVKPIIAAIENKKPDYFDDFSSQKLRWFKAWGEGEVGYKNGEFYMTTKPKKGCTADSPILPFIADFVLEVDQYYVTSSNGDAGICVRAYPGLNQKLQFTIKGSVQDFWVQRSKNGKDSIIFFAKKVPFIKGENEVNHITLFLKGALIAAFVNYELVGMFVDPVYSKLAAKGKISFFLHQSGSEPHTVGARWDNLKIWDLSKVKM